MKRNAFSFPTPWVITALLLTATLIGSATAFLNPGNLPWQAFFSGFLIALICIGGLWIAWKWAGGRKWMLICMTLAFLLRILFGFSMIGLLPQWGYPEPAPQHGYLYLDAFQRDRDAWQLAQSDQALAAAFGEGFSTDQYGGLLSLSAAIYRTLSPDAQRPALILILAAFFPAMGIPFLWQALSQRWNKELAGVSCWIFALYPESIILGGSQMREPFIIGLSAVAFWGVVEWKYNRRNSFVAILLGLLGAAFFSWMAAAALAVVVLLWFFLDHIQLSLRSPQKKYGWIALVLVAVLALLFSLNWLTDSARWDLYLMESSSGRIQFELDAIGRQWRIPFIVTYGFFQPVLPAALAYPGILLMRVIALFRSLGWYAIAPILLFSLIAIFREKNFHDRSVMFWFWSAFIIWVFISSIRAGGDQWDNVRYRALFTIFMSISAGWGLTHLKERYAVWLKRFYLVEGMFVLVFLQWYLSRYYRFFGRLRFWTMILVIVGATVVILTSGYLFDRWKLKKSTDKSTKGS